MQEITILSGLREVGIKLVETGKIKKGNSAYAAVAAEFLIEKLAIKPGPSLSASKLFNLISEQLVAGGKLKASKSRPVDVMQFLHAAFGIDESKPLISSISIKNKLH